MTTLVAAHDAGGAEVVSSWIVHQPAEDFDYLLEGPARAVFARKGLASAIAGREDLPSLLSRAEQVLCATSWASDLEKHVIAEASRRGLRTAAYLDHWIGYRERFEHDGTLRLPDELWVGDEHALARATQEFPDIAIRLEPNRYLADTIREIHALGVPPADEAGARVLYLTEPIAAFEAGRASETCGYTEEGALAGFVELLRHRPERIAALRVRVHPAEKRETYQAAMGAIPDAPAFEISSSPSLARDIAWADWVVGLDSMAMVVGVLAGKRVSTAIPRGGRPPVIPYPQIERLFL